MHILRVYVSEAKFASKISTEPNGLAVAGCVGHYANSSHSDEILTWI